MTSLLLGDSSAEDDRGLTVIELLVGSLLSMIVVMMVLSMLDSGTKSERVSQARHSALLDLRAAVSQMTQEVRQATYVDPSSDVSRLAICTRVRGTASRVVYQVAGSPPNALLQRTAVDGPCTRPVTVSGTAATLTDRIVAPQAFCYHFDQAQTPPCRATTPPSSLSSIRIDLELSPVAFSEGTMRLATDVQLRNIASS